MDILHLTRLDLAFDTELLKRDLNVCTQIKWRDHYNQQAYNGQWTAIGLRSPSGTPEDINAYSIESGFIDSDLLDHCPYFREVADSFKCEKGAIRLMNLQKGSSILKHDDHGLSYASGLFRLHIPVMTNEKVDFIIGDTLVHMKAGECWYGNFECKHSVANNGETDRVHLILDCYRNDWTDELFKRSGISLEELLAKPVNDYSVQEARMIIENLRKMNTTTSLELANEMERKYFEDQPGK